MVGCRHDHQARSALIGHFLPHVVVGGKLRLDDDDRLPRLYGDIRRGHGNSVTGGRNDGDVIARGIDDFRQQGTCPIGLYRIGRPIHVPWMDFAHQRLLPGLADRVGKG